MKDLIIQILPFVQITVAVLLVATILLQQRGGGGLSGAFGGGGDSGGGGGFYGTRRGIEKLIFRASIVFAALFLGSTFLNLIL